MNANIDMSLRGRIKPEVYDPETGITIEYPWQDNLILNGALNVLADDYTSTNFFIPSYASLLNGFKCGAGDTPNSFASTLCGTPVSASQTGNIVSLTNTFGYIATGDVLKYDSGTSVFLTSSNAANQYTCDKSLIITPAEEFTIWKTSRTALDNYLTRADRDFNTDINTGSNYYNNAAGILSATRTMGFPASTSNMTIKEVGLRTAWDTSSIDNNGNVDTRVVLDTPINIPANQVFKLTYEMYLSIPLLSATYAGYQNISGVNMNITGWTSAIGQFGLVKTNNVSYNKWQSTYFEHGGPTINYIAYYTDDRNLTFNQQPSGSPIGSRLMTSYTYVNNTFKRIATVKSLASDFNSSNINTILFYDVNASTNGCLAIKFDTPQTKDAAHDLTIYLTKTISRDL
jgi:hypothetical protein